MLVAAIVVAGIEPPRVRVTFDTFTVAVTAVELPVVTSSDELDDDDMCFPILPYLPPWWWLPIVAPTRAATMKYVVINSLKFMFWSDKSEWIFCIFISCPQLIFFKMSSKLNVSQNCHQFNNEQIYYLLTDSKHSKKTQR